MKAGHYRLHNGGTLWTGLRPAYNPPWAHSCMRVPIDRTEAARMLRELRHSEKWRRHLRRRR